jgi:hypothetical protein
VNDKSSGAVGQENDILFLSLIFNFQAAALQQMGKMVNPMTGKTERDMNAAKQSIDLLDCLERKTRGNLIADEERAMQEILTNLRLNYVDEMKRGEEPAAEVAPEPESGEAAAGGDSGDSEN